ncbi:MAG TPA: hypothetical protein VD948_07680 [Rhodothermales bacterium]|nr:hypothetical protein [Rhodothermales bacterium]
MTKFILTIILTAGLCLPALAQDKKPNVTTAENFKGERLTPTPAAPAPPAQVLLRPEHQDALRKAVQAVQQAELALKAAQSESKAEFFRVVAELKVDLADYELRDAGNGFVFVRKPEPPKAPQEAPKK